MIDLQQTSTIVDFALKLGAPVIAISVVLVGLLIWQRTRSTHVLWTRVWGIFNGKKECAIPFVKEILDEQHALMQFRFTTGIQARTLEQVRGVRSWSRANNEGIDEIAACGSNFDCGRPGLKAGLKLPGPAAHVLYVLITSVVATAAVLGAAATLIDQPILRFNESGTWFTVNATRAKPLFGGTGFLLKDCAAQGTRTDDKLGFNIVEVKDICSGMSSTATREFLADSVIGQRIAFGILFLYFGFGSIPLFKFVARTGSTRAMADRLAKRKR